MSGEFGGCHSVIIAIRVFDAITYFGSTARRTSSPAASEIEGPPDVKVEQAFELSDATTCAITLNKEAIVEHMTSNITLMNIDAGQPAMGHATLRSTGSLFQNDPFSASVFHCHGLDQGRLAVAVEKRGNKNVFSGTILEIEGLSDLKVELAFELSDAPPSVPPPPVPSPRYRHPGVPRCGDGRSSAPG